MPSDEPDHPSDLQIPYRGENIINALILPKKYTPLLVDNVINRPITEIKSAKKNIILNINISLRCNILLNE